MTGHLDLAISVSHPPINYLKNVLLAVAADKQDKPHNISIHVSFMTLLYHLY
jgi:hypothetical protein